MIYKLPQFDLTVHFLRGINKDFTIRLFTDRSQCIRRCRIRTTASHVAQSQARAPHASLAHFPFLLRIPNPWLLFFAFLTASEHHRFEGLAGNRTQYATSHFWRLIHHFMHHHLSRLFRTYTCAIWAVHALLKLIHLFRQSLLHWNSMVPPFHHTGWSYTIMDTAVMHRLLTAAYSSSPTTEHAISRSKS